MINTRKLLNNASWDIIHETIDEINEATLEDDFDFQLYQEDKIATRLSHITTFANKETYIEAINDFLTWYWDQTAEQN